MFKITTRPLSSISISISSRISTLLLQQRQSFISSKYHHVTFFSTHINTNSSSSSSSSSNTASDSSTNTYYVDTLIIGGSAIGSSLAYHLSQLRLTTSTSTSTSSSTKHYQQSTQVTPSTDSKIITRIEQQQDPSIVILERDLTFQSSSAVLSAGGIRQQFTLKENILMSSYGAHFLKHQIPTLNDEDETVDVQFFENGYLFLAATQNGVQQLQQNLKTQQDLGIHSTKLLSPTQLSQRFPWLNTNDLLLGSYGTNNEGYFDPWSYIQTLQRKNKSMGVKYIPATAIRSLRNLQTGHVNTVQAIDKQGSILTFHVQNVVNAAGANAESVMNLLYQSDMNTSYTTTTTTNTNTNTNTNTSSSPTKSLPPLFFPVKPRKRCIFHFHCSQTNNPYPIPTNSPLTIDPYSSVYFRSEGSNSHNFICGVSPPPEQDSDYHHDDNSTTTTTTSLQNSVDYHLFDDIIWPALYHRVPSFGNIKVNSAWAGLYEYNTMDQNAIIDFHPEMRNVLMVNGFSGHGLMHSPAAGRAGAELLENDNRFIALDLNIFRFDRLLPGGNPIQEKGII